MGVDEAILYGERGANDDDAPPQDNNDSNDYLPDGGAQHVAPAVAFIEANTNSLQSPSIDDVVRVPKAEHDGEILTREGKMNNEVDDGLVAKAQKRRSDQSETSDSSAVGGNGCDVEGVGTNWDLMSASKKTEVMDALRAAGCPGAAYKSDADVDLDPEA